ncbi:MAG: DUF559 domain-containing protein [Phenylobacterium sp.]|uniref:endonuclease domain-containing protein n=1 Tax=Phenylobacterium sp. TaxID=1871053 RepID=UPI001A186DD2|nr:DUF559 domain-containing protein [Phenylobacterium sp.]MBJ7413563.1 DUF559 domain-containing protein [Phenylobacterium sp.]
MRVISNATLRARRLRKNMSLPEVMLWRELRGRGDGKPVFRRQYPFGPFVLDFYCPAATLCVEIDGEDHYLGDRPARDARRDGYLRSHAMRVVRVPAHYVLANPQAVAEELIRRARAWAAPPPPLRGPPPP